MINPTTRELINTHACKILFKIIVTKLTRCCKATKYNNGFLRWNIRFHRKISRSDFWLSWISIDAGINSNLLKSATSVLVKSNLDLAKGKMSAAVRDRKRPQATFYCNLSWPFRTEECTLRYLPHGTPWAFPTKMITENRSYYDRLRVRLQRYNFLWLRGSWQPSNHLN